MPPPTSAVRSWGTRSRSADRDAPGPFAVASGPGCRSLHSIHGRGRHVDTAGTRRLCPGTRRGRGALVQRWPRPAQGHRQAHRRSTSRRWSCWRRRGSPRRSTSIGRRTSSSSSCRARSGSGTVRRSSRRSPAPWSTDHATSPTPSASTPTRLASCSSSDPVASRASSARVASQHGPGGCRLPVSEFLDRDALKEIGSRYHQEFVGPPLPPRE